MVVQQEMTFLTTSINKFEYFASIFCRNLIFRNLLHWNFLRPIYLYLLKGVTLNRGLPRILYPGVVARVSYASRHTMSSDFKVTQRWDLPCLYLLHQWIERKPDTCFFDIGANHGQFSLVVSHWFPPHEKRCFAFEPHPENSSVLKENLQRNNCLNVEVVNLALAAQAGTMMLYGESVTASLQSSGLRTKGYIVDVDTLDSFCERTGVVPDIMKIDVEGFELEVLRGGLKTLITHQDDIRIICEMHTFMWNNPDFDLTLIKLIESCGLRAFTLDGMPVQRIREYGHYVLAKHFECSDG